MLNSDQKRAFAAVLLSGLVLFGWQYYFAPKKIENNTTISLPATKTEPSVGVQAPQIVTGSIPLAETIEAKESTLINNKYEFKLKNNLSVVEMKNPNSLFDFASLSDATSISKNPLHIQVVGENGPIDLNFQMTQVAGDKSEGKDVVNGVTLTANMLENGKTHLTLVSEKNYKYRFTFNSIGKKLDNGQVRKYALYSTDVKFIDTGSDKENEANLKWLGVDYNFHLFAFVLKDKIPAKYKSTEQGNLIVDFTSPTKNFEGDFVFTKKNYDTLVGLGDNLHLSVDFGFFAILAVPILRGLQFIHEYIPNYGIAIILLTILIRLVTFPLQYKSFKSMKKMQVIQPELQKIKEKYKDEPQKMQKETMDLFKKAGANPISGCLPMLLQMPFFFAIYRVLSSSVELVGAPFAGWINDLSIQDPFYVLPVLMGLSMLLQQKMTPQTSVDPTQQKIMMFMPVIFAFIMKSLPAGLVLYIFISTIVGVFQQKLVYNMAD